MVKEVKYRFRSEANPGKGFYGTTVGGGNYTGIERDWNNSRFAADASFFTIKNITLGYNFNYAMLKKVGISNARIYVSAKDPFTFTNYIGYNPEVSSYAGSALTPGVNYYGYPLQKTLTLGVNVTF